MTTFNKSVFSVFKDISEENPLCDFFIEVVVFINNSTPYKEIINIESSFDIATSFKEVVTKVTNTWLNEVLTEQDDVSMTDLLYAEGVIRDSSDNVLLSDLRVELDYKIEPTIIK